MQNFHNTSGLRNFLRNIKNKLKYLCFISSKFCRQSQEVDNLINLCSQIEQPSSGNKTNSIMLRKTITIPLLLVCVYFQLGISYSATEDARLIKEFKRQLLINATRSDPALNHPKIARQLVHQANWASVGTISVDSAIKDYPMVNIISVNDNDVSGESTGRIQFLLTDLDFTGPDWEHNNKCTILFTDEQLLHCTHSWNRIDPMEPTCARTIISGHIVRIDKNGKDYDGAIVAFVQRHPAATNWLKAHNFYLCELNITNIYVLDFYGGPHSVSTTDYYNIKL